MTQGRRFRAGLSRGTVMGISASILLVLGARESEDLRAGNPLVREFMAFYTVGHVLNTAPDRLYDADSFTRTYHSLFPAIPAVVNPLYAHAPFEAVVYSPFARLP